ncbi:MAG: hypothetical protein ACLFRW_07910 [Halorhodospira sp.]
MSSVGGVSGGASAQSMQPPSTGSKGDPFAGEQQEQTDSATEASGAASGGADTVELSEALGGDSGGSSTESSEEGESAASYDAEGSLEEGQGGGSEIDAMI